MAAVTSALPVAPAVPWVWDSVHSVSLGVLCPSFQGLYLGQSQPGLGRFFPRDWMVLFGVWFFIGLWQGKVLDDLQGRIEVLDMT